MKRTLRTLAVAIFVAAQLLPAPRTNAAPPTVEEQLQALQKRLEASEARTEALQKEVASLRKALDTGTATAKPATAAAKGGAAGEGKKKTPQELLDADADPQLDLINQKLNAKDASVKEESDVFITPESPAAAVLGIAPKNVIHADTPKMLIGSALSGLDENGHFQSGLAIDWAPLQWLHSERLARRRDPEERAGILGGWDAALTYGRTVANRTQLSLATIRGTEEEDKSSKIALGIPTTLLDADDPTVREKMLTTHELPEGSVSRAAMLSTQELRQIWAKNLNRRFLDDRDDVFQHKTWLTPLERMLYEHASWSLGAAPMWISEDGSGENYEYNGTTAWSTFTFSLDHKRTWPVRLLVHFRYRDHELVPADRSIIPPPAPAPGASAPKFVEQDSLLGVAGIRVGTNDINATASVSYLKAWQDGADDDALRYSVQAEYRISSNSWLTLSVGRETGHTERKDDAGAGWRAARARRHGFHASRPRPKGDRPERRG